MPQPLPISDIHPQDYGSQTYWKLKIEGSAHLFTRHDIGKRILTLKETQIDFDADPY